MIFVSQLLKLMTPFESNSNGNVQMYWFVQMKQRLVGMDIQCGAGFISTPLYIKNGLLSKIGYRACAVGGPSRILFYHANTLKKI